MKGSVLFVLLYVLLGSPVKIQAQQNEFQDSRNFITVSAGTLTGMDGRIHLNDYWFACFNAGYFRRKGALGGSMSLSYTWPVGLFQKNRMYTGLGYLSHTSTNFIGPLAKLGYRLQFGQSPIFLYAEWQPWVDDGVIFRPTGGQLALAFAFKRADSRRRREKPHNGFYDTALGVKFGTVSGLSMRLFTAPQSAIQMELDYNLIDQTSSFSISYGYSQSLGIVGFFAYANIGGGYQLGFNRTTAGETELEVDGLVVFIAGLEYNIFGLPFQVALQWEPRYGVEQGFNPALASLALRYTF